MPRLATGRASAARRASGVSVELDPPSRRTQGRKDFRGLLTDKDVLRIQHSMNSWQRLRAGEPREGASWDRSGSDCPTVPACL